VRLSPKVTPSKQAQRNSDDSPAAGMSRNRRLAAHAAGNIRCQLVAVAAKQSSLDWRGRGRPNEMRMSCKLQAYTLIGRLECLHS
jgi:hypothetical protein